MQLLEIFNPDNYTGYRSEKDDSSVPTLNDIRKTKLTLAQLNRLRIMNDVRQLEHEEKLSTVKTQYKVPSAEVPQM